jgi:hypothetical protein
MRTAGGLPRQLDRQVSLGFPPDHLEVGLVADRAHRISVGRPRRFCHRSTGDPATAGSPGSGGAGPGDSSGAAPLAWQRSRVRGAQLAGLHDRLLAGAGVVEAHPQTVSQRD